MTAADDSRALVGGVSLSRARGFCWALLVVSTLGCGEPGEELPTESIEAELKRRVVIGRAERVSVSSSGVQGNDSSTRPGISRDGRVVAFVSDATNLVPGDTNGVEDIFVRDLRTGRTERVSVASDGAQGDDFSDRFPPALDRRGRFVAFESLATNLVPDDTNGTADVFVRDRARGTTERVSLGAGGVEGDDFSTSPAISANGRYVAFVSSASNLVAGDGNGVQDVFVRDRARGTTSRVSVATSGAEQNGDALSAPALSDDARFVAFASAATNLTPEGVAGVFVRDRRARRTTLVSVAFAGPSGGGSSGVSGVDISADGRFIAFDSTATNLVPNDTNGVSDVFVRDLKRRVTERISVSSRGEQANDTSGARAMSADGRFVAFISGATNLVPGVPPGGAHVYVRDRLTRRTWLASRAGGGSLANGGALSVALSGDGRALATWSLASNLVPNDTNGVDDVFVRRLSSARGHWHSF